ncbi:MAG: hypothetical protein UHS49_06030 [Faecalimonas sp.]|nr:hypothetical protein [Faecalimonas sp.]
MRDILLALIFLFTGLYGYVLMVGVDRFFAIIRTAIIEKEEKRDDDR